MKFNPEDWQWKNAMGVHLIEDIDDNWLRNIIGVIRRRLDSEPDAAMVKYHKQEIAWLEKQMVGRADNPVLPSTTTRPASSRSAVDDAIFGAGKETLPKPSGDADYWTGRNDGIIFALRRIRGLLAEFERLNAQETPRLEGGTHDRTDANSETSPSDSKQ